MLRHLLGSARTLEHSEIQHAMSFAVDHGQIEALASRHQRGWISSKKLWEGNHPTLLISSCLVMSILYLTRLGISACETRSALERIRSLVVRTASCCRSQLRTVRGVVLRPTVGRRASGSRSDEPNKPQVDLRYLTGHIQR